MKEQAKKRFISFEGIDFSGKSTQIAMLRAYLEEKGDNVFVLREPGGTAISEEVRRILLKREHDAMNARTEILLFSAARAQLTAEKVMPLLDKDYFVLADRFVDSTTAYQGFGRGLEHDFVDHVNQFATFGLLPGHTFYLRLTVEEAFARKSQRERPEDRLEQSGLAFYEKVVKGYDTLAERFADRFRVIDATQDISAIHRQVIKTIDML